jgi:hypothetical protein
MKEIFLTRGEWDHNGLTHVAEAQLKAFIPTIESIAEANNKQKIVFVSEEGGGYDSCIFISLKLSSKYSSQIIYPNSEGDNTKPVISENSLVINVCSNTTQRAQFPELKDFISHWHNLFLIYPDKKIAYKAPYQRTNSIPLEEKSY